MNSNNLRDGFSVFINEYNSNLYVINNRFLLLDQLEIEFKKHTSSNEFKIKNEIILQFIRDSFDMLIIDLSSFYDGLKNFFNKLYKYIELLKYKSIENLKTMYYSVIEK